MFEYACSQKTRRLSPTFWRFFSLSLSFVVFSTLIPCSSAAHLILACCIFCGLSVRLIVVDSSSFSFGPRDRSETHPAYLPTFSVNLSFMRISLSLSLYLCALLMHTHTYLDLSIFLLLLLLGFQRMRELDRGPCVFFCIVVKIRGDALSLFFFRIPQEEERTEEKCKSIFIFC